MGLYLTPALFPQTCDKTKVCLAQMPLSPVVPPNLFFVKSGFSNALVSEDSTGSGRISFFWGVGGEYLVSQTRDLSHLLAEAMVFREDTSNHN